MGAEIHDFVARRAKFGGQFFLQFKAAVIGCDSYAHGIPFR